MSIDKIKTGDDLTQSLDIISDNISKLKALFPEVLTEGKVDFKVLKEILGNEIEEEEEFYRFTWAGKSQARREAHKPSTGTLRPCKEESVDWDTTQNLYIEGDNLEVLKLLQKSYSNKVKMIYIDPPYNTGKDFVYKDNYKDNLKNYQQITGQVDDEGNRLSTNSESDGRFHSNWLNMIYPRLKLARNLLKDDGVIFISIDDNEVDNLRKICDEIFGEDNFKNQIILRRGSKSVQSQFDTWDKLGQDIEYILFYTKKSNYRFPKQLRKLEESREGTWNNHWRGTDRPTMRFPLFNITPDSGQWRWGKERSYKAIENYNLLLKELGETYNTITQEKIDKYYLSLDNEIDLLRLSKNEKPEHYIPPTDSTLLNSSWYDLLVGSSSEINNLFDSKVFDTAKLTSVIDRILGFCDNQSIILDFFSGSATTAHSVMKKNSEDGGNRKFILVQIPEITDEKSEAFKSGFIKITEIGKERIRRAGKKIKEENPLYSGNLDIGFKVFKLDSSNIKGWDGLPENLEKSLFDSQDNIKSDRTEEDVLFEILLKYGLDLTLPIEEKEIEGKKVFNIGYGALFICLGNGLTSKVAEGIGQWKELLNPETCRVIFKDGGFNDVEKTNSVQTLKRFGIQEIKSI